MGDRTSDAFRFTPKFIHSVEFLTQAIGWKGCQKSLEMRMRLKLLGARLFQENRRGGIAVDALKPTTREGFRNWLDSHGALLMVSENAVSGVGLESTFAKLMRSAGWASSYRSAKVGATTL